MQQTITQKIQDEIDRAAGLIAAADGIVITAGAGIGVDSGLPDFRGTNEGFWSAYPALGEGKISFMEIANGNGFSSNPKRSWGFYGHRLNLYRATVPHAGFHLLQQFAESKRFGSFVFTSNVDGQFQKAGYADDRIVEVHGSIHQLQCVENCKGDVWSAADLELDIDAANCLALSELPVCMHCWKLARPNILMFNDSHWESTLADAQMVRFDAWRRATSGARLVVIELGAGVAIPTVRRAGESFYASMIRINPVNAKVSSRIDVSLPLGSRQALEAIALAMKGSHV